MIVGPQNLAYYLEAQDASEQALSAALYRHTPAGISLRLVEVPVHTYSRQHVYKVLFVNTMAGVVATHWQASGKGELHRMNTAPPDLVACLRNGEPYGPLKSMLRLPITGTLPEAKAQLPGMHWVKYPRKAEHVAWITTTTTHLNQRPGIELSTTVEGTDYTITEKLAFPFSARRFQKTLHEIETKAAFIWNIDNEINTWIANEEEKEEAHA